MNVSSGSACGGGRGGGGLNLSTTSTAGDAAVSVAFDYGADSLAVHDSPSGTGGFLYTVPSPSPTAPSCSLRLSGANGSGNGPLRAARSPTVIERRRLVWDGSSGSSSGSPSTSGSNGNTPAKRRRLPFGDARTSPPSNCGDGGGATFAADGFVSSTTTPLRVRGEGESREATNTKAACRVAILQHQEPQEEAGKVGLPSGAAEGNPHSRRPRPTYRSCALDAPAGGTAPAAAAGVGAAGGSGNGLFAALLENISLSQILPSQGTTQGTAGTQGEHDGSGGAPDAGGSSSSGNENKPGIAPAATEGLGGTQDDEEEAEDEANVDRKGARQQQKGGLSVAADSSQPIEGGDGVVLPREEEGLWGRSRLGRVESLALQDSGDEGCSGLGWEAHARHQPSGASPLGTCYDQPSPPPPPTGDRADTAATTAEAVQATLPRASPVRDNSGGGMATHDGEAAEAPQKQSILALHCDTAPAQAAPAARPSSPVPGAPVLDAAAALGWRASRSAEAAEARPAATATPSTAVTPAAVIARAGAMCGQESAGGEGSLDVGRVEGRGAGSGGEVATGEADGGDRRDDSAELSVISSLNLELSLTPEVKKCCASH